MAMSVNNWGSEAIQIQKSADRVNRSGDWSTLTQDAGDATRGRNLVDSYVPLDRDYSREERAKQQKQLHDMMQSIRAERNQRGGQ